jgi:proton-coupled amino acid transporter
LLQVYDSSSPLFGWLLAANTLVSLSVLVTLPLQLFPAVELVAPWWAQTSASFKGLCNPSFAATADGDEKDLAGFEPLPPLPEHELYEHEEKEEEEGMAEHHYDDALDNPQEQDEQWRTGMISIMSLFPTPTIPGDSPQLRTILVLLTYTVAVVVPNVQSLISLAGAVTGSSTALLIPPLLELAWLNHLEKDDNKDDGVDEKQWLMGGISSSGSNTWLSLFGSKWWKKKLKCWILLLLGSVFCGIGSWASLADIIAIYTRGGR